MEYFEELQAEEDEIRRLEAIGGDKKTQKKRKYFSSNDDVDLIKSVLNYNPFLAKHGDVTKAWEDSASSSGLGITWKSAKDRVELLLRNFRREDTINRNRTGSDETVTELDTLLQGLSDIEKDSKELRASKFENAQKTLESQKKAGEDIRDAAMKTIQSKTEVTPEEFRVKRKRRDTESAEVLKILKQKAEQEKLYQNEEAEIRKQHLEEKRNSRILREKELEVEREKLKLETDRFELERNDKEERRKQEHTERMTLINMIADIMKSKNA